MSRSVWSAIEPHLRKIERPSRYLDHERGITIKSEAAYRCALIYPDTYEIGQSNLGLAILYHILNGDPDVWCERSYLPWVDLADIMRARFNVKKVVISYVGPVIGAHSGPGTIALFFLGRER